MRTRNTQDTSVRKISVRMYVSVMGRVCVRVRIRVMAS